MSRRAHLAFTTAGAGGGEEVSGDMVHFPPPLTVIGPFLDRYMALSVTTQLHYGNQLQHIAQIKEVPKRRQI